MFLKRFCIKKSFIRQGLFLAFLGSISFNVLNASELKTCESEEDKKVGCIDKQYYENGKLLSEYPYKNGKLEGIEKAYDENGNLWFELPLKNDKREGIAKEYYESGNLKRETPFKNDKFEGIRKVYYESGNILLETPYTNDKVHGSVKFYSKKLLWQANAQNGNLINGKCANGKPLTNAHLARINKDINEDIIDLDFWYEICDN